MNNSFKVALESIMQEPGSARSYYFNIPDGLTWEAGSDMHFAYPDYLDSGVPDKSLVRHMSLITLPEDGKIGFTTRVPGSGSVYKKRLESLTVGDELVIFKLGNRFPLRRENRPVVLISMGVGVAAMRPMIISWVKNTKRVPSVTNIVVDKKEQFLFREEFEAIKLSNFSNAFLEHRSFFYKYLESNPFNDSQIFYIVGSDDFLADVIVRLKEQGIKPENIEIDKKPEKRAEMLAF